MRALGLEDACIFGASQGGMIAQTIAIENPSLVGKLALGSTSSHAHPGEFPALENWIRLAKEGDPTALYLDFGRMVYPAGMFEEIRPMLLAGAKLVTEWDMERFVILAESTIGFDVTERLGEISCPVLLLGSEEDRVLGGEATREIANRLRERDNVSLHMYSGYGHAAYDLAPDYKERLLQFFESRQRPRTQRNN